MTDTVKNKLRLRVKPAMTGSSKHFPVILIILLQIVVQMSCVKEPLYDTDHPEHGKITLTTVWDDRGAGIDIPGSHTAHIGDHTATLSGVRNIIDHLFSEGHHPIHIYNVSDGITVSGTTATADYFSSLRGGQVGVLGWFFTGSHSIVIEKDKHHEITVPMRQQVRQLTLELEITGDAKDRVSSIETTLSGVAGAISLDNGNPTGNPVSVELSFMPQPSLSSQWITVIRLLGITGSEQNLTVTLNYSDGNPSAQTIVCDLNSQLADFNADKKTKLSLNAQVLVTPTETGLVASITDWIQGETTGGTAE